MARERRSRQEIDEGRRREEFVGREEQLEIFARALSDASRDRLERFLIHINGYPAIGKTALVRRMADFARSSGALVARVDESVNSPEEAMTAIRDQLVAQKVSFKAFDKCWAAQKKKRDKLLTGQVGGADSGTAGSAGKIALQVAKGAVDSVPVAGSIARSVDPHDVAQLMSSVRRRAARLDQDPVAELTTAFVQDLDKAAWRTEGVAIAFFFDTYERTREVLDQWLSEMCTGTKYGRFPSNVVLTLAGQEPIDLAVWRGARSSVTHMPLDPLTETEVRRLLQLCGITDEARVREIFRSSEGLPLYVLLSADLLMAGPAGPDAEFIKQLLKGTDPSREQTILAAALPLWLNEDVFRAVAPPDRVDDYSWLTARPLFTQPLIAEKPGHLQFHPALRRPMLQHQLAQSPARWRDQHERLAAYFGHLVSELETKLRDGRWEDKRWLVYYESLAYHHICADPVRSVSMAVSDAVSACTTGTETARRWAALLIQAGEDAGPDESARLCKQWGERLNEALASDSGVLQALKLLIEEGRLEPEVRLEAYQECGRLYEEQESYEEAMASYNLGLDLDSENVGLLYWRSRIHILTKDYEPAIKDLTWVLRHEFTAGALTTRGIAFHQSEQYEQALEDYTAALELEPDHSGVLTRRAQVYKELGRRDDALKDLNRVVWKNPKDLWALGERGEILRLGSDYAAAIKDFTALLEADPNDVFAWERRALCFRGLGDDGKALEDFNNAVKLNEKPVWALIQRATTHEALGHHQDAIADCTEALRHDSSAWAYAVRGGSYQAMGERERALADFDKAIGLDADYRWALERRSQVHRDLRQYEKAISDLDRVLQLDPSYTFARARRGTIRQLAGHPDLAHADFEEALHIAQDDKSVAVVLSERCDFHVLTDQFAQAESDVDECVRIRPENAYYRGQRGVLLLAAGRLDQALDNLDEALRMNPDDAWARAHRGVVLRCRGQLAQAQEEFTAVTAMPGRIDTYAARAEIHRLTNHFDLARADLDQSIERNPRSSFARVERAVLASVAGGIPSATRYWAEAEDIVGSDAETSSTGRQTMLLVIACATGKPDLLSAADAALAAGPLWMTLFEAVVWLTALAEAPGVDVASVTDVRAVLAQRLDEITPS